MKFPLIFLMFLILSVALSAQQIYTITADSTKLTGCDSNELIIENHTQNVPGFLYNTGKGRTAFRRPLKKISDTLYLVGADTLRMRYPAWVQGGNRFGVNGVLGTWDNTNLDFFTNHTQRARLDTAGNLLLGYTVANGYKLDINGPVYNWNFNAVTSSDPIYDIRQMPGYVFATGVGGTMMSFGSIIARMGVNKVQLGNIPAGSLIIGGLTPLHVTAITDYNYNPVFVVDGNGKTTINGGYAGIGPGGTPGVGIDNNAPIFSINGGRGTGTGNVGDIVFSTGTAQASGNTIHAMVNRWWLKGGTGNLSNTSTPASEMDVAGDNGYSQLRMRTTYTPTSSADTNGNTGNFSWDGNYFYVKTATGWKRAALTTF